MTVKKKFIIFSVLLAGLLSSCSRESVFGDGGALNGSTTVTFSPNFGFDASEADTKAFADVPQVENLYLAVFNEGGKSLVEYVKAEPLSSSGSGRYTYTAQLKTSDKPREIHFIANGPEGAGYGSDADVVGVMACDFDTDSWSGDDAYWGYLKLEDGICDASDASGFAALEDALSDVKLVRNFARIKVATKSTRLVLTRFWLSNFPERGSIAPYNRSSRRFETDYITYGTAADAVTAGYGGFSPASGELVTLSGLDDAKLDAIATPLNGSAYVYECEKPAKNPLCVIVAGKYDGSEQESYYKFELRDADNKYLPVLRNFTYTLNIGEVKKVGESTVEAALKSVASGAIDTDVSLQNLNDLSNGKSRIAVSLTEQVVFTSEPFTLKYSYIPDITTGEVVNTTLEYLTTSGGYADEAAVRAAHIPYVTITSEAGLSGKVIDSYVVDGSDDPKDNYRSITMTPVATGDIVKNEVFTVTGHVWNTTLNKYETLSRTVNYQMRKRPDMVLTLTPDRVRAHSVGERIDLSIGVEDNLPQSFFTLDMKVTTEQMTLTPAGNNLPISSEVGADGKPTFYMTRAITWEEYRDAPSRMDADGIIRKYFNCSFKTNTDINSFRPVDDSFGQGDRVIVSNANFNTASALFIVGDDDLKRFINPQLDKEYFVVGRPATVSFGMTGLPEDGWINVRLNGLEPVDAETLVWVEDETDGSGTPTGYSLYRMQVDKTSGESFEVRPKTGAVTAYFQLVREGEFNPSAVYEKAVTLPGFSDLKFLYNGLDYVVAGKPALVSFHMDYPPLGGGSVTIHLKNAVPADGTLSGSDSDSDGFVEYEIPVSGNDVEFPVRISPATDSETKAYFKLTGVNFASSGVVGASIEKLRFSRLRLINLNNTGLAHVIGGKPARISFTLDDMPSDGVVSIELANLDLGSAWTGLSGITPVGEGKYELAVTDKDVTINVTPVAGETSASYKLTDTEFIEAGCSAEIKRLSFTGLRTENVYKSSVNYLIGGRQARIHFGLEELPADGTVSLTLTNLTPDSLDPASGKMSGISAISGSDGTYELTVSGTSVSIDVTPTIGSASATATLTDAEFYDASCSPQVHKLDFSNLAIINADPADSGKDYLIIGNAARISFSMDDIPLDGKINIKLIGMTGPVAVSGISAMEPKGSDEYELTVTGKNVSLDATVASGVASAGVNLTDAEFYSSAIQNNDIRTRYTIDWANVQVKTDYTSYSVAISKSVAVYTDAACTTQATDFGPLTTNESGYVTNGQSIVDVADGTTQKYFFKFTNNDINYLSESGVTLAQLAAGTASSPTLVTCNVQPVTYTFAANTVTFNYKNKKNGKTDTLAEENVNVYFSQTGSSQASFNTNTSGKNGTLFEVTCIPNTTVYFKWVNNKDTYWSSSQNVTTLFGQSSPSVTLN